MAQGRVTEYFSSRKKTFDVIQPSKKPKLDLDTVSELNTKISFQQSVINKPCLPTSAKRVSKRKQMTTTAGNIKSFFESASRNKQSKLCAEETSNDKTQSDSSIWQKGIKPSPQSSTTSDNNITRTYNKTDTFPEKVKLDFSTIEEATPTLKRAAKQEPVTSLKGNIRLLLERSAHKSSQPSAEPHQSVVKGDSVLLQKEINTAHTTVKTSTTHKQSFEKVNNEKTLVQNSNKPSGNKFEDGISRDKHVSLREKIKQFKEAASKIKVQERAEPKEHPSNQQFHSLPQKDVPVSSSLVLPFKYRTLCETFRATETIVSMLYNRKEVCTFDKLKQSVQHLTKRSFDRDLLGKIASVFPDAYKFSLEKPVGALTSGMMKGMQLTITPVLTPKSGETSGKLNPTTLLERREIFQRNLVAITKKHHESFLASLKTSINVPSDKIMRWHPKFIVDDVPDIPVFSLPKPPEQKVSTAKDVLEKMNGIVCSRMEKALLAVINDKATKSAVSESKPTPGKVSSGPLKGISQELLDKIRKKESAKFAREMVRSPESEKRLEMLDRLPEMVRILRSYFVVEKRAAIALEDVKVKIRDSFHSPISPDDVEQHLKLLRPIVPKWITYVTIPRGVFIKVDKNVDPKVIIEAINAEILKEKS